MIQLYNELKSVLNTPAAWLFLVIFLLTTGALIWLIPGTYYLPGQAYASPAGFFSLAPVLLTVLIPALAVGILSEEKKHQTPEILLPRPLSVPGIVAAKVVAVWGIVTLALLLSSTSLFTLSYYALPQGNIDGGAIGGAYAGIWLLSLTFVSITVFASSLTSHPVMAFILALFGCAGYYYGFELLSALFSGGSVQLFIRSLGLYSHVTSMQQGMIDSRDVASVLSVAIGCFLLTCHVLSVRKNRKIISFAIFLLFLPNLPGAIFHHRWDLTDEKRYTISRQSRSILKDIKSPLTFEVYLDGELNAGFTRLKQAVIDLLTEFSWISPGKIHYRLIDPYRSKESNFIAHLNEEGIRGIVVNEHDRAGTTTQKTVFPWLKIIAGKQHMAIPLLHHSKNKSVEENLNLSVENLEYQLITALYSLKEQQPRKIAFLEGHDELPESEVADVTEALSRHYQIDRGTLSTDVHQLSEYECIIVAGAQQPFSEQEKFILDQYLMNGGRLLLLINGVKLSPEKLAAEGRTPTMINELNLDDMLFTYGIRINPVLIQDLQCLTIQVQTNAGSETPVIQPLPWYFAPVLYPATNHPITRGLMLLKSEFVSSLSFVGRQTNLRATPLLSTSGHSHTVVVPEMITWQSPEAPRDSPDFREPALMVAALLEGTFRSVFNRRAVPEGINTQQIIRESVPTKIIVAGTEELIRNETQHIPSGKKHLPAGYDKYMDVQFGNHDFLLNAVNYLTDHEGLTALKKKHLKIRLLDRNRLIQSGYLPATINLLVPLAVVCGLFLACHRIRKKKYSG
jgi:ABC-2 type transport system permease protein